MIDLVQSNEATADASQMMENLDLRIRHQFHVTSLLLSIVLFAHAIFILIAMYVFARRCSRRRRVKTVHNKRLPDRYSGIHSYRIPTVPVPEEVYAEDLVQYSDLSDSENV